MPKSPEQIHQPSPKEVDKDEKSMTLKQQVMSEEREENYNAGYEAGRCKQKKDNESEKFITIEQAEEILGNDFYGAEAIKNAFGIELKNIPEIPFTKEDLEKAKELKQILVLYADKTPDGEPLTGEKIFDLLDNKTSDGNNFLTNEPEFNRKDDRRKDHLFDKNTSRNGWKLVSKGLTPGSENKDYFNQTLFLADYLKEKVFKDKIIPLEYKRAIKELNLKKETISSGFYTKSRSPYHNSFEHKNAVEELANLAINKITRESSVEIVYRMALCERQDKKMILLGKWAATSDYSFNSAGNIYIAYVGAPSGEANLHGWGATVKGDEDGFCFSRSF